jgi:hypothetical protein
VTLLHVISYVINTPASFCNFEYVKFKVFKHLGLNVYTSLIERQDKDGVVC